MRRDWLALYARSGGAARVDQRADGEHQPPGDERPATERSDRRQRGAACQVVEAELAAEDDGAEGEQRGGDAHEAGCRRMERQGEQRRSVGERDKRQRREERIVADVGSGRCGCDAGGAKQAGN